MPLLSGGDEDNLDRARSFAASLASSAAITGPDGLPSRDQGIVVHCIGGLGVLGVF